MLSQFKVTWAHNGNSIAIETPSQLSNARSKFEEGKDALYLENKDTGAIRVLSSAKYQYDSGRYQKPIVRGAISDSTYQYGIQLKTADAHFSADLQAGNTLTNQGSYDGPLAKDGEIVFPQGKEYAFACSYSPQVSDAVKVKFRTYYFQNLPPLDYNDGSATLNEIFSRLRKLGEPIDSVGDISWGMTYYSDQPAAPSKFTAIVGARYDSTGQITKFNGYQTLDVQMSAVYDSQVYPANDGSGNRGLWGTGIISSGVYLNDNGDSVGWASAGKISAQPDGWPKTYFPPVYVTEIEAPTAVKGSGFLGNVPSSFKLSQNYPNPFNPSTTVQVSMPKAANVSLKVYDTTGKTVAVVYEGRLSSGEHTINWNAGNLPSGAYFMELQGPEGRQTRKMELLK